MITIREFDEADRPALREIFLLSRKETFVWLPAEHFLLEDFDEQTQGEKLWVAKAGNHIAGFIAIWIPDYFVHHLYVHPSHKRKGIGKALLNYSSQLLRQPFTLKCLIQNRNALRFYISQGWKIVSQGEGESGGYYVLRLEV